ncbi:MAG: hypothetical protein PF487_14365 [Bacteroidales bacterium]|jgi:hypothetical protein|nr:hypothetical protein [Bacteroidales bacterium]
MLSQLIENKINKSILIIVILLSLEISSSACTTAIISGKYTKDGRPLLWKLRDTDFLQNKLMYFNDGKYDFLGLVNSQDIRGEEVWAGTNSTGFSIMNAASYNVNLENPTEFKDQEGKIMKLALQKCASLEDFEKLLNNLPRPLGLATSFGVIDAKGGAAYYETDNTGFVKFNANDPISAPQGYLIRTNFSYTGKKDIGYGFIRYQTAQELFSIADATDNMNYKTLIQNFSRSFYHSLIKKDYANDIEKYSDSPYFINSGDLITRQGTASVVVVRGVKKGESADFTTMWNIVGYPHTTVAIPLWVKGGKNIPNILKANKNNKAPLCNYGYSLKAKCYPIDRSSGYKYMNITALINRNNTGIQQKIIPLENKIIDKAEKDLNKWQHNNISKEKIQEYYSWVNNIVNKEYKNMFGL